MGLRAGGYAARAACAVVVSKCPARVSTENMSGLQDPDFSTRTTELDSKKCKKKYLVSGDR